MAISPQRLRAAASGFTIKALQGPAPAIPEPILSSAEVLDDGTVAVYGIAPSDRSRRGAGSIFDAAKDAIGSAAGALDSAVSAVERVPAFAHGFTCVMPT